MRAGSKGNYFTPQQFLQQGRIRKRVSAITPESFTKIDTGQFAPGACPAIHSLNRILNPMLPLEPFTLALVRGQHEPLSLESGLDVHHEIRLDGGPKAIQASNRVHEVEMP